MAKLETYVCDVCGEQKKEANHWFVVARNRSQLAAPNFLVWTWATGQAPTDLHLCGLECLTKLLARWTEGVGK